MTLTDIAKMRLGRNSLCPCGSKRKVKHCCVPLLKVRSKLLESEFSISAALAANNRAAAAGKPGHTHMGRAAFIEKIREEQEAAAAVKTATV